MLKQLLLTCTLMAIVCFRFGESNIVDLDSTNFEETVQESDVLWIIGFCDPQLETYKKFIRELKSVATTLKFFLRNLVKISNKKSVLGPNLPLKRAYIKGIAKVGAVESSNKDIFKKYKVKTTNKMSTVKIFHDKKPYQFKAKETKEELLENVINIVEEVIRKHGNLNAKGDKIRSAVIELTDSNFNSKVLESDELWLVEFYAPWCGHCKNLKPEWEEAAKRLKGKINMGALDATKNNQMSQKYEIRGFPTIKLFNRGKMEEYTGGRTADDIENWVQNIVDAEPLEIPQLIDENKFQSSCVDKKLCVIAFLPHLLDCQSNCRNAYLDMLKDVRKKKKSPLRGWIWVEGGSQTGLESALNIGGFGYPALAVVNFDKSKYAVLKGSFSQSGLTDFFSEMVGGRMRTEPLEKDISIVDVPEWDGKDVEPITEDNHEDL